MTVGNQYNFKRKVESCGTMMIRTPFIEIQSYLLLLSTLSLTATYIVPTSALRPNSYRSNYYNNKSVLRPNNYHFRPIILVPTTTTTRLNYRIDDDKTNTDNNVVDSPTAVSSSSKILIKNPRLLQSTPNIPVTFVRWNTPDNNNNNNNNNRWEIQTAVTTFVHPITNVRIELHALLHYGDKEYYNYYNSNEFNTNENNNNDNNDDNNSVVLYELLLDETLVTTNRIGQHVIKTKDDTTVQLQASPKDQEIAKQYGWVCQVDGIDYEGNTKRYKNTWVHADFTRQELLKVQQQQQQDTLGFMNSKSPFETIFQRFGIASEAAAALFVGPPMIQQQQQQGRRQRRLFTNLFLSGDSFAIVLRWILWLTVPCPEISILLLDSSSVWFDGTEKKSNNNNKLIPGFSPIVVPLLQAIATGNIQDFRRLLFGQVITATNSVISNNDNPNTTSTTGSTSSRAKSSTTTTTNNWDIIVTQRNDKVLQVLQDELNRRNNKIKKVSILYGSSHCPDLYQKLITQDYKPTECNWRTAWSVQSMPSSIVTATTTLPIIIRQQQQQQQQNEISMLSSSQATVVVPAMILLVSYLGIGAFDWIGTIHDVAVSLLTATTDSNNPFFDAVTDTGLYLFRHVILYVVFSRFVLDWKKIASAS